MNPRGCVERRQALACLAGAALFSVIASRADEMPLTVGAPASRAPDTRLVANPIGCGTKPVGEVIVATLDRTPIITVSANGHPVTLILDTGAERTILTPAAAERVGARSPRVAFPRRMRGVTGTLATGEVELSSFTAGNAAIPWRRVLVAPVTITKPFATPLDGLFGVDALSNFDIDLDLPRHRMVLYAKQTCPDAAPDWPGPYAGISVGRSRGDHLFFPVQLDGRRIVAFIDTGTQTSILSMGTARALGVSEAALAHDRSIKVHGPTAGSLSGHVHQFSRLEVGAAVVRNPELIIADITLRDADLVLGVDFLSSRRLWLSFGSLRIFIPSR